MALQTVRMRANRDAARALDAARFVACVPSGLSVRGIAGEPRRSEEPPG